MNEFLRKMIFSAVITSCIIYGFLGICTAYSQIRKTGFGDYRNAVEIKEKHIEIFDYKIKKP